MKAKYEFIKWDSIHHEVILHNIKGNLTNSKNSKKFFFFKLDTNLKSLENSMMAGVSFNFQEMQYNCNFRGTFLYYLFAI